VLYLNLWMIRRNAKSHQSKRRRQTLIHIDHRILYTGHHLVGCIESGRSRADDCHPKWPAIFDNMAVVPFLHWSTTNTRERRQSLSTRNATELRDNLSNDAHRGDSSVRMMHLVGEGLWSLMPRLILSVVWSIICVLAYPEIRKLPCSNEHPTSMHIVYTILTVSA